MEASFDTATVTQEPLSAKKSFRKTAVAAAVEEGEREEEGVGKSEGFRAVSKRRVQDRCWIIPRKWSMGSITCLVPSEKETKDERWRRLPLKGNTAEEAKYGLNSTKLSGYVDVHHSNKKWDKNVQRDRQLVHFIPLASDELFII